ncbi:hypothetical protein OAN38_01030 [Candidatus Marinimicrobia bacterium]|nr:hypothetical protein [Candidatus Neomarinimicrobiota bacterium]
MKNFIKDIGFYFLIMMTILFLIGYQGFDLSNLKNIISKYPLFTKKADYFETFIKDKNSINLILGSSLVEDSIIPDSLGNNWFSFTNGSQNIYNSYKFLEFYQDLVKIDTIIIGIQPFDLPYSYIKNREQYKPYNSDAFHKYGSYIVNDKFSTKNEIQKIKSSLFPDLLNLIKLIKHNEKETTNEKEIDRDVWTKQGFSGRINHPALNLDNLYNTQLKNKRWAYNYFYNVNKKPNMKYFDLFNDLAKSLNIKLIYVLTPKSKYYHLDLAKYGYDSIWSHILDSLESRKVKVWNYEKMNTENFKFNWFWDDTHSSYDGAKAFTKIIRKRLRD